MLSKNEAQEKAINTIYGPLMVVSCPGSGKTTTLLRRIENMIHQGINPKKILMVTFTKSAAIDMNNRYKKMFGVNPGIVFATIHSLCLGILKKEGVYTHEDIISADEQWNFFFNIAKYIPNVGDITEFITSLMTDITKVKNNYIDLKGFEPDSCDNKVFTKLFNNYETYKKDINKIDFDDILIECENLFKKDNKILEKWQERFEFIQIDEYQDVNLIQKNILYNLSNNNNNICVVGDDDQSIYKFRGADSSIMMNFKKDFPDAKIIFMSTNYRSGQKIVDISNKSIQNNNNRFEKDFISFRGKEKNVESFVEINKYNSEFSEMNDVSFKIENLHQQGLPYEDIAILFRNSYQSEEVVRTLVRKNIPFSSTEKIKTIYDSFIFKDILSYLNLSMGIDENRNLLNIINKPNRFLKTKYFYNIDFDSKDMFNAIEYLKKDAMWKYDKAYDNIELLLDLFANKDIDYNTNPRILFNKLEMIKYEDFLKDLSEFKKEEDEATIKRWQDLKKDALKHNTIRQWLDFIDKYKYKLEKMQKKNSKNSVKLSTIHKSKGMEWDTVFLIGVNKDLLPSKKTEDIEEERRLFYVAMTRAENNLYVSSNKNQSPFILEIERDEDKEVEINKRNNISLKNDEDINEKTVIHKKFGKGIIKGLTQDEMFIFIYFKDKGIKKFLYPSSFDKGLIKYV
jgi:hypothetical protein